MGRKYTAGIRTRVRTAVGPLFEMLHIYMVWLGFAKTHTYPVWGMTMLRQIRSTGPMRGWVQSGVCSLDWALMEYMELVEGEIDPVERI